MGGTFWGNARKGVEKLFGGSVGGAVNPKNFSGQFLKKKKKILEKCQRKKFGGEILGVVRRGACDAVGMVRNEKKGKFSPKNLGTFLGGVVYRGTCVWGTAGK